MRRHIDLDALWLSAREQALELTAAAAVPACPFSRDDLLADRIDSLALATRLRATARPDNG